MQIGSKWRTLAERLLEVRTNIPENRRRGRLLARIVGIAIASTIVMMLFNVWSWLVKGSAEDGIFALEDVIVLAAFWGVWLINRSGRTSLATHFLLGLYIVSALAFLEIHDLNHAFLIFAAPVALASFLVKPGFSFLYACIAMLALVLGNALQGYPEPEYSYVLNGIGLLILSLVTYFAATYLIKTEVQVGDSEGKYRSMFDNVPIGLYRTAPDGRILDVNSTFLRMFGYPDLESIQKVNAADLYADPSRRAEFLESVASGATHISELHVHDAYGRTFWVADYTRPVNDDNGRVKYYEGSLIDTTSRRMAEEASLESLARLEALVGNMPQGALFEDELRRIQFANKAFCNLFGIPSVGSILGEDCVRVTEQTGSQFLDPEGFIRGVESRLAERKIVLAEELSLADGRIFERDYIPLNVVGKYVGSYWLYRDITDRKRAEEALHRREAILEVISDASRRFLKTVDWTQDILPVLEQLGQATQASRAYIFQNSARTNGEWFSSQRFEWTAEGVTPQIDNLDLQNIPLVEGGFKRWVEVLGGNKIITGHVREFPSSEREVLAAQDICSLIVVPIFDGNEWWGFFGFDECRAEREWSLAEMEALMAAAGVLSAAIQRQHIERDLRESEARLRGIVQSEPECVKLLDADGNVLDMNAAGLKMIEADSLEQILGKPVINIIVPEYREQFQLLNRRVFEGQGGELVYEIVGIKGTHRWLETHAVPLLNSEGQIASLLGVTRDITERKQSEERIREQVERLAALRAIDSVITASTDLSLSLNAVLDQAIIHLRVDAADILLLNSSLNLLEYAAGKGFHSRGIAQSRLRLGEGYAGKAALTRKLAHIHDLKTATPPFTRANLLAGEEFDCYYAVPLIAKGNVVGVLETFHRHPVEHDREWLDFLESLAGQAAIGIDNASLFENLQRSNMDLTMAYETTLEGWSAALDLRDKETEGHTQRVTELTQKLASSMGIRGQDLVNIRRGALLHDIGKMGVPDNILLKQGALNPQEWEAMRKHPQFAYDLLNHIAYLRGALDIPYCHHEKWDGTGYPRGLRGAAIPLAARIFAVVDVYDALTGDRPYRSAWPRLKTLDHIRALSGTHFDPEIVKVFLHEMGEE